MKEEFTNPGAERGPDRAWWGHYLRPGAGHAMSALVFDIIRRYLEYRGYTFRHVMNYTDVDDKIINRAKQLGEDPLKLSQRYINDYVRNLERSERPASDKHPSATQTMGEIRIHGRLIDKGTLMQRRTAIYFAVTMAIRQVVGPQTRGHAGGRPHRSR
jgi:cysteinyl-tRNA synthetase